MKFEFWAIDPDGNDVRGIREARNRDQLISELIREQLVPMNVREPSESQLKLEKFKAMKAQMGGSKPDLIPLANKSLKPAITIDYTYLFFILILAACFIIALFHRA